MTIPSLSDYSGRIFESLARLALFVIFFWFGILKVLDLSPATPLVQALFERTISFMPFPNFLILFGVFEMVIGVLFLIRGYEKVALVLLVLHMICAFLPLFIIPSETWSGFLVPTMDGQYIIKNLALIVLAIGILPASRKMSV